MNVLEKLYMKEYSTGPLTRMLIETASKNEYKKLYITMPGYFRNNFESTVRYADFIDFGIDSLMYRKTGVIEWPENVVSRKKLRQV